MGYVDASFPSQLWDGLTGNPDRLDRSAIVDPNLDDWDKITAEVIAIQEFILSSVPTVLYSNPTSVEIQGGEIIFTKLDGTLALADSSFDKSPSGISLTGGAIGESIIYKRQGSLTSNNWVNTTGSVNLVPGVTYYLVNGGMMSTVPPTEGYLLVIGQAQSLTTFDINIQPSIKL